MLIALGTVALLGVALLLISALLNLWPIVAGATAAGRNTATGHTIRVLFGTLSLRLTSTTALILLALIGGAVGSLIHTATSFADYVGNRHFYASWVVWYVMRLLVGMSLALLVYFVLRAGLLSGSTQPDAVNPYGVAALCGLAGLFSKQATDKLRELLETLFHVSDDTGDGQRMDRLSNGRRA